MEIARSYSFHAPNILPPCSIDWCDYPARGELCDWHKANPGHDTGGHVLRRGLTEKFWEKVDRPPGRDVCWRWTGSQAEKYGQMSVGRNRGGSSRPLRAHTVAWYLATGQWVVHPSHIRHMCDLPLCVRVSHLTIGSSFDNAMDSMFNGLRASTKNGWTTSQLQAIYNMRLCGFTLQEIGDKLGISRERVRQLESVHLRLNPQQSKVTPKAAIRHLRELAGIPEPPL